MEIAQAIVKIGQKILDTQLGNKLLTTELIMNTKRRLAPFCGSSDLALLAYMHETDKFGYHSYTKYYQRHFAALRNKSLNLLEIGIGGYESPTSGGASLKMWKQYFPKSNINGIDIHDKSGLDQPRIKTFQGDQADSNFLRDVAKSIGRLDIVIDDGSHVNQHVIDTFELLFPLLSANGIYVIEDVQTSYWPNFGGSSTELTTSKTTMGYFKQLLDGLNYQDMVPAREPNYFDKHITELYFYHNLIFIQKGLNDDAPGHFNRPSENAICRF